MSRKSKQSPNREHPFTEAILSAIGNRSKTTNEISDKIASASPTVKTNPIIQHAYRVVVKDVLDSLTVQGKVSPDSMCRYRVSASARTMPPTRVDSLDELKLTIAVWIAHRDCGAELNLSDVMISSEHLHQALVELANEGRLTFSVPADPSTDEQ